ncbi:MAG: hypothetical protein ABEJ58_07090 [Halodesulfurarchaeum sp.]
MAKDNDWLPLHADDRVYPAFNRLVAWIFAGGSLEATYHRPSFTVNHRLHLPIAARVVEPLGIEWRVNRATDADRPPEIRPREGGQYLDVS